MSKLLQMPFVSGKDSLSSTYRYPNDKILKIPPVLLISVFGKVSDVTKTASADFKKVGSTIVLVGRQDTKNLGGSVYFDVTNSSADDPNIDLKNLNKVLSSITKGIQKGKILAAHDVSEGGLAATLAEMCFGGGCGAEITFKGDSFKGRPDFLLFNETVGTFLVEVDSERIARQLFKKIPYKVIGMTLADKTIRVNQKSKNIVTISIEELKQSWQTPMKEIFHA